VAERLVGGPSRPSAPQTTGLPLLLLLLEMTTTTDDDRCRAKLIDCLVRESAYTGGDAVQKCGECG